MHIRNRVILLASGVQLLSWTLPFFTLRENRVVSGQILYSWDALPIGVCIAVGLGVSIALALAARAADQRRMSLLYGAIILLQIIMLCIAMMQTSAYTDALGKNARIGLQVGFWTMIVSSVIIAEQVTKRAQRGVKEGLIALIALVFVGSVAIGAWDHVGIYKEFINNQSRFFSELLNHIFLVLLSVGTATVIGIPLGIYSWRNKAIGKIVFPIVNSINTIPSLALFGLIIAPLSALTHAFPALRAIGITGIGNAPAFIALSLYALLPIVQNTYSGLANIPHSIINAAIGMGMNNRQLWRYIEFPIAFALIFNGFRIAMIQTVGNATVAALIGAAGLGNFIFRGLGSATTDLIMLGVLPIVLLALVFNQSLASVGSLYQRYVLHRKVA